MEREDPDDQNDKREQPAPESSWNSMPLYLFVFLLIFIFLGRITNKPAPKENPAAKTENLPPPATANIPDTDCESFYKKSMETAEYLPEVSIAHSLLYQNCLARKKNQPKTPR